jgi:hypothetical protein
MTVRSEAKRRTSRSSVTSVMAVSLSILRKQRSHPTDSRWSASATSVVTAASIVSKRASSCSTHNR